MTDEELAGLLIAFIRSMQAQGVDLESISAALFGLGITITIERLV